MKKIKVMSGAALKYIALFSMLCDHVNKAILVNLLLAGDASPVIRALSACFDVIGRIALPIFAFLLVEGFFHTRSRGRYLGGLMLFALLSEIPFNLFTGAALWVNWHQNIYFTLALGFGMIWLMELLKRKTRAWLWLSLPIMGAACLISMFGSFDYDLFGILTIGIFFLFRGKWFCQPLAFLPLCKTPWAGLGYLLTCFYNGERGRQSKWLAYWFYPTHLLVLGVLRMLLFA